MKKNDNVFLYVLMRQGGYIAIPCSASFADRLIQSWWKNREVARGALETLGEHGAENVAAAQAGARHWLETATYASNVEYEDGGSYCRECFAWSEVVAMYVRQPQAPDGEERKYGGGQ